MFGTENAREDGAIALLKGEETVYINNQHLVAQDRHLAFEAAPNGDISVSSTISTIGTPVPDKLFASRNDPEKISGLLHQGEIIGFKEYFKDGYLARALDSDRFRKETCALLSGYAQYRKNFAKFSQCSISETFCTPETLEAMDEPSESLGAAIRPHRLFLEFNIPVSVKHRAQYNKFMTMIDRKLRRASNGYCAQGGTVQEATYKDKGHTLEGNLKHLFSLLHDIHAMSELSLENRQYIIFSVLYNFDGYVSGTLGGRVFTQELKETEIAEQQEILATQALIASGSTIKDLSDDHREQIYAILNSNDPNSKKMLDIVNTSFDNLRHYLTKYRMLTMGSLSTLAHLSWLGVQAIVPKSNSPAS